jgi:hypothetical protein
MDEFGKAIENMVKYPFLWLEIRWEQKRELKSLPFCSGGSPVTGWYTGCGMIELIGILRWEDR